MEYLPWEYGADFHHEGNKIDVAFQLLPIADIMASVKVVHDEPDEVPLKEEGSPKPHLTFGPCPNTQAANFNLKKEVEHLPFMFIMKDVPLEKEHRAKFIDLIYSD